MIQHQENVMEASDTQDENSPPSTILAIDYSTTSVSYSIWEDSNFIQSGVFYPTEEYTPEERFTEIYEWLEKVTSTIYKTRGEIFVSIADTSLSLRKSFTNTSPAVLFFKTKSQLLGVIKHLCVLKGYDYDVVPAHTWKSFLGIESRGKDAQKDEQIILMDSEGIEATYQDIDAICLGYYTTKEKL